MRARITFKVSLRIWHPRAAPQDVAAQLGLPLETSWEAGKARSTPAGKALPGVNKESYCVFKIEGGESDSLQKPLTHVTAILAPHEKLLNRLVKEGGRAELFVACLPSPAGGDVLPANLLSAIGRLSLDLAFDIYSEDSEGSGNHDA